ncbi:MAG: DUF3386 family protein [Planctomycetes bacterium]|nr:DUF3386 family protein [Planctomycetota bacterium]
MKQACAALAVLVLGAAAVSGHFLWIDADKGAKADPQATSTASPEDKFRRMIERVRASRAQWEKFPGFSANAEVEFDGKQGYAKVTVDATGKVSLENLFWQGVAHPKLDAEAQAWTKQRLAVIVSDRLPDGVAPDSTFTLGGAGQFTETVWHHPLGRAVVAAIEHDFDRRQPARFRVRANQIILFNGKIGDVKYTLTVLQSQYNKEGKCLPGSYVIHFWDPKTGVLQKTESHSHAWQRVGNFDLPESALAVTATKGLSTRSVTLSQHQLSK